MTYDEALTAQRKVDPNKILPSRESEDQVWDRCCCFFREVLGDAITQHAKMKNHSTEDCGASSSDEIINVLVVSHSNFLRIVLRRILGEDGLRAHKDANFEHETNRFIIPNASLTILKIELPADASHVPVPIDDIFSARLKSMSVGLLTSTQHLDAYTTTTSGE